MLLNLIVLSNPVILVAHSKKLNLKLVSANVDNNNIQSILPTPSQNHDSQPVDNPKSRSRFQKVTNTMSNICLKVKNLSILSSSSNNGNRKVFPIDSRTTKFVKGPFSSPLRGRNAYVEVRVWTNWNPLSGVDYSDYLAVDQDDSENFVTAKINLFNFHKPFLELQKVNHHERSFSRSFVVDLYDEIASKLTKYKAEQALIANGDSDYPPPFRIKLMSDNNINSVLSSTSSLKDLKHMLQLQSVYNNNQQWYLNLTPIYTTLPLQLQEQINVSLYLCLDKRSDYDNYTIGEFHHFTIGGGITIETDFDFSIKQFVISIRGGENSFISFGYLKQMIAKKYGNFTGSSEYSEKFILEKLRTLYRFRKGYYYKKNEMESDDISLVNKLKSTEVYEDTDSIQLEDIMIREPHIWIGRRHIKPESDFLALERIE